MKSARQFPFSITRFGRGAGSVLFALGLIGCATPNPETLDPGAELVARTGHGLRDANAEETLAPGVTFLDGVTEEEAVAQALWSEPNFQVALADLGISRALIIEAGQLRNPSLSLLFPLGPKQLEWTAYLPVEALWLRPRRMELAASDYRQLADRLVQSGLATRRNARAAFVARWQASRNAELLSERAQVLRALARLRRRQAELGGASERDAARAELDAVTAEQAALRAGHQAEIAERTLRLQLALESWSGPLEWRYEAPPAAEDLDEETLITGALANRPDLRAAEIAIEQNGRRVGLARLEIYNAVISLDSNGTGQNFNIGPGLNRIPLPLFHRNEGRIEGARALLRKSLLAYAAARSRIVGEVQQAHRALLRERDEWRAATDRLEPAARELVEQTRAAERAGGASEIDVLRAEIAWIDSRLTKLNAQAQYHTALAELERALGLRLKDLPRLTVPLKHEKPD